MTVETKIRKTNDKRRDEYDNAACDRVPVALECRDPQVSSVAQATGEQVARRRAQVVGMSERLVDLAEKALRQRLAAAPHDAGAWRRLADTQRMLGRFSEARESYRRSLALAPDAAADWAHSVLTPAALPNPPAGGRAVPFVQIGDFLSPAERQQLWIAALAGDYGPAKLVGERLDSSRRSAAAAKGSALNTVRRWFLPKLRTALPAALARLGADGRGLRVEKVGECGFELSVTAHHADDYYTCHTDNEDRLHGRRLSYVYYFHRQPRRFTGGDLLLYDTDYDAGIWSMRAYSRLAAADNTLVLFPSDSYHEITKVAPASGETLPFGQGRFTVNGWIHETQRPSLGLTRPQPDSTSAPSFENNGAAPP